MSNEAIPVAGSPGEAAVMTSRTALLVMDFQRGVLDQAGGRKVLGSVNRAVRAARRHGILVVFVKVEFRPQGREISARNRMFGAMRGSPGALQMGSFDADVDPQIDVAAEDLVVVKRRVSAFSGSDLEVILRAEDVTELVLAGVSTSGVVLSTALEAADKDFRVAVLHDACFDPDREVHRLLTEKVFPGQGRVAAVAEWEVEIAN